MVAMRQQQRTAGTLRHLDFRIERLVLRTLQPIARHMTRAIQQALTGEPGVVIARYRQVRPEWPEALEGLLAEVVTLAIKTARQRFQRQIIRRYGIERSRRLFAADEDEGDDLPGIDEALAGLLARLLYQPDTWGLTPLERLTRQDMLTSRELWGRLQETGRQWRDLLLLLGGLTYLQGTRLQQALREIEHEGRRALAASPADKRRFLETLRQAREGIREGTPLDVRVIRELEESVTEGRDAAREAIVTEQLEQRALRRAEVLLRTLAAQAYAQAQVALARRAGVQYVRWGLSSAHPRPDQCDEYAEEDHGYGEGVYPLTELPPFPPHPRCLCTLEILWPETEDRGEEIP